MLPPAIAGCGALEANALREFLGDVEWGRLDALLIDLPPGADAATELEPLVPHQAGVLAITIPSEESRRSVARAMRAAAGAGLPLLGIVENMSGYACGGCERTRTLFPGDAGCQLAAEFDVPLLAQIPFDPAPLPLSIAPPFEAIVTAFDKVLS
jgi:ATP-binding protein involved in chromosome partitioning